MKKIILCATLMFSMVAHSQLIHLEAESYTASIGVQIEATTGTSAGKNVGFIDQNDWMEYTVSIPSTQSYQFRIRVASAFGGKTVGVNIDGDQIGTATVGNTGGWTTYTLTTPIVATIAAGTRTMRIVGVTDGFNVDFVQIIPASQENTLLATAGGDQSKPAGQTVALDASFSWPGNTTITGYSWARVSGSGGSIVSPTSAQTNVAGLPVGTHVFRVTTTGANAATSTDDVTVTIAQCAGTKYSFSPGGDGGALINGSTYAPGDTLQIMGGNWEYIYIHNLRGTAQCPITIINNGVVQIKTNMALDHCWYVNVHGRGPGAATIAKPTYDGTTFGWENMVYGFYATRTNGSNSDDDIQQPGFVIGGRSKNVNLENIRVYKKTYIAWIKQDPACPPAGDSLNWQQWVLDSITIKNVHAFNIYQDGVYAGNTDPVGNRTYDCATTARATSRMRTVRGTKVVNGKAVRTTTTVYIPFSGPVPSMQTNTLTTARKPRKGARPASASVPRGVSVHLIPMRLGNIRILNVFCDSANRSAIQLGGADSGYQEIAYNVVRRAGYEENQQQGTGIWIGGLTSNAYMHDNWIAQTFLYSFGCLGVNKNWMYRNRGDSAGMLQRFNAAGVVTGHLYNDERWVNPYGNGQTASYPSNVFLDNRPTWGPIGSVNNRGPEWDSTTVFVWANKFGSNVGESHIWAYDSYNTYDRNQSIIADNVQLDGTTPAIVDSRHNNEPQFSDFVYTTNAALIPPPPSFTGNPPAPENVKGWRKFVFKINSAKFRRKSTPVRPRNR